MQLKVSLGIRLFNNRRAFAIVRGTSLRKFADFCSACCDWANVTQRGLLTLGANLSMRAAHAVLAHETSPCLLALSAFRDLDNYASPCDSAAATRATARQARIRLRTPRMGYCAALLTTSTPCRTRPRRYPDNEDQTKSNFVSELSLQLLTCTM